ncbi:uncharacterized protein LOC127260399 [Andrographis paniculata]|uniref:uncharacterized protein LOC127260399 n=1 Tax=Andrographis paniculata TaxID=175694 RepID=UPI0021E746B7|nr:uncharacterized protein LOC127260399 [Andrographis paniculata]
MVEDTRTLRKLAAPNLTQQPLCINFPTLNNTIAFELKYGLIYLLPSFHGLASEEPHKHLQEVDVVCSSMKPPGVTDEQIKLRAFLFSLKDASKDWLYYLPPGSIDTWNDMKKKFLEKNIIDVASGGSLVNKMPAQAWDFIARMVENTQQFGLKDVGQTSGNSNDHYIQSMQQQLYELTSFVHKMVVEKSNSSVQVKACGICTSASHPTDACPTLQEGYAVDVNAANYGVNGPPVYNPYSNTYIPS